MIIRDKQIKRDSESGSIFLFRISFVLSYVSFLVSLLSLSFLT